MTLGFQLFDSYVSGVGNGFGYGSYVGFAAAAAVVALAVARIKPVALDRRRLPFYAVPIAACVSYLVIAVLPWWDVLPRDTDSALRLGSFSRLTIVGALLAIHLVRLWALRINGAADDALWLIILPLASLALGALDLIRLRESGITWGGGAVVGLCLLLAWLGWSERNEGLENLKIPEILRVDRL